MRRCETCGHTTGRLRQATNYYTGDPLPGQYVCISIRACIRRMEQEGQWIGKRVLRRIDKGGTEWTIRRGCEGVNSSRPWFVLTCEYRQHRTTSMHVSIEAAKAHADEWLASFTDRNIDAYRDDSQRDSADQLELA